MSREDLRARILATADPKPLPIKGIPGWEGVYVKPLTVGQIEDQSEIDPKVRTARGLARTLCDAEGALIFDPGSPDDLALLNRQGASILKTISEAVERLNVSTEDEAKDLGKA